MYIPPSCGEKFRASDSFPRLLPAFSAENGFLHLRDSGTIDGGGALALFAGRVCYFWGQEETV